MSRYSKASVYQCSVAALNFLPSVSGLPPRQESTTPKTVKKIFALSLPPLFFTLHLTLLLILVDQSSGQAFGEDHSYV